MNFLEYFKQIRPEFLLQIAQSVIFIVIILILAKLILSLAKKGIKKLESKNSISAPIVTLLNLTLRWVVFILTGLLVLSQLGFSMQSIWTMLSAILAMVAVGFVALWSILSNVLCTFLLLIFQPFKIGDEIEILEPTATKGLRGKVKNLNMMYTVLEEKVPNQRTIREIRIPNNMFFQKSIRTYRGKNTVNLKEQLFEENSVLEKK